MEGVTAASGAHCQVWCRFVDEPNTVPSLEDVHETESVGAFSKRLWLRMRESGMNVGSHSGFVLVHLVDHRDKSVFFQQSQEAAWRAMVQPSNQLPVYLTMMDDAGVKDGDLLIVLTAAPVRKSRSGRDDLHVH